MNILKTLCVEALVGSISVSVWDTLGNAKNDVAVTKKVMSGKNLRSRHEKVLACHEKVVGHEKVMSGKKSQKKRRPARGHEKSAAPRASRKKRHQRQRRRQRQCSAVGAISRRRRSGVFSPGRLRPVILPPSLLGESERGGRRT